MIATELGRLVFSVVFVVLAVQSIWLLWGAVNRAGVMHHIGGAVMSLGMAIMAWPAWLIWPVFPQALLFVALAACSVAAVRSWSELTPTVAMHRLHHVVMLVAMAWMVMAMGGAVLDPAGEGQGSHDHAGMDLGLSASAAGVVLTAAMIAVTALIVVRFALSTDDDKECGTGATASCALMGAGMVAMSWTMVAG